MYLFFIASVLITTTFAAGTFPNVLLGRQSCPVGFKICGSGCIASANTCCPDSSGDCEPTDYCQLGSNNKYLCCPRGEVCGGTGGVQTSLVYNTQSSTNTFSTNLATATGSSGTCSTGWKTCGAYCIPTSWTCCPDKAGGCDPEVERCWLGSNGRYGCCKNIYASCSGAAGLVTSLPSDYSDTTTPRTTSRSSSRVTSIPAPVGASTTFTSAGSATTGGSAGSDAYQGMTNPIASLFSFAMAGFALIA